MCNRIACPPPPKRLRISELNPHLLCALCGGYLIDATTIIECLHSFCKTCILRYLETSTYCPICEVLIHKTRPWQNIRLDHSLQNAVYKMVPGLFQDEMRRRREFYEKQNLQDKRGRSCNPPQGEFGDRIIFSQDEEFSISIEFSPDGKPVKDVKENKSKSLKRTKGNCQSDKRYLKCPAGLRVEHLKKFIRSKFSLPHSVEIDLFHEAEPLSETFSLMDVAYIYHWKRDCVLRLFYSFYEIPPKVRKVESVTKVTEKISKGRIKDKSEEKSDKRDDDKKPKNKSERSKEKKQSKLSGKRKVSAGGAASVTDSTGGAASVTDSAVTIAGIVFAETVQVGSVKCKDINTPATPSVSSSEYMKSPGDTSYKMDRDTINSLAVAKCSTKGHATFLSPTKQKPPPESSSFSVVAHSSSKDGSKISKDHHSKTSIKLLIKSSDIKDCKSQNGEFLSASVDMKHHTNDMLSKVKNKKCHNGEFLSSTIDVKSHSNDMFSKGKNKKFQNGESTTISTSNLFEKMSTFARSSQMELKDFTAISDSYSSQLQNQVCNSKTLREAELSECDIKSCVNITKMKTASKVDQSVVAKKRVEGQVSREIVKGQDIQSQNLCMSANKAVDTKQEKCSTNNSLENEVNCDVAIKDHAVADIKAVKQDTKVFTKCASQSYSDCKMEMHSVKPNGAQGETCIKDSKVAHSMQQNAHDVDVRTQDTNQNDIKLGQPEHTSGVDSLKESGFKSPMCDTKLTIVKTEPNSTTEDISKPRNICDSINHTKSKESVGDTKQTVLHPEQSIAKKALDDSKHNSKQNSAVVTRATSESKGKFDATLAVVPKTTPTISEIPTVQQKIHNGVTKIAEISNVQNPVNKLKIQDPSVSKAVHEAADKEPLCHSNKKALVEPVSVISQSDNQQQLSSSNLCSVMSVAASKPRTSEIASVVHSVTPKIRVSYSEVNSAELNTSSSKHAFVSRVSTTTTSSSPLPAPPKLLKTMVFSTVGSSSCLPTSYSIASIVSVPVFKPGSIPASSFTATSQTSSPAANVSLVSRSCDVATSVLHKAALPVVCTTTVTRTSLVAPVTSSVPATTSSSFVGSGAMDTTSFPVKGRGPESGLTSVVHLAKLPEPTTSSSDASILAIASTCVPAMASLSSLTTTAAPSIVLPVTASPTASSIASSTTVVTTLALTVTTTATSSWCTDTTVNVANTFLNMPPKESPALKNTQRKSSSRVYDISTANMTIHKEAIKLDNFLFDTKPSEKESVTTASSHKVKDSCTPVRQIHKGPLRTKSNSSAQIHGMMNNKSLANAESHITATHHLPKTISHTSKPYPVARSMSVSSASATKCNSIIQTTKISTLIPKSSSISSKAGAFSKSFSYPSTLNSVPSSRSFLHTSLPPHMPRPDLSAVINGSSGYERALLTKTSGLSSSSSSLHVSSAATTSSSHHRPSTKHSSKDGDKMEKNQKSKAVPPLTIPKSCLTTLKLQRSPGSTDHYIFAPLSHYSAAAHHNGERSKSKEVKYNGSRTPTSPPSPTKDSVFIRERQRVPTIKISDINRNPIIVESGGSSHGNSSSRHHSQFRSYNHGSSRSSSSDSGSARAHSRGGSDSNSPTGSSDRSDRSPARDARRPSDSELLLSQHWHEYSAADLLFNGFKLPTHPKFHDLHYDTDAMPLDYSQSSSKT